jgi:tetratricopeptide (TPR) repeat protein
MALNLNPNLDVVYASLGDLYTATGKYGEAENAYKDALEIDSNNSSALNGLGKVYRLQGRLKDAEATIRKAVGLHPGEWATYNTLGMFLYRTGRYAEAAEQFRIMTALDSSNARAYTNLATALVLAEEHVLAESAYQRALELEPNAFAYSNLGMFYYTIGRYDEAVEKLRNAVALADRDYLTRSNLGDALRAMGHETEATEVFHAARELALEALTVNPKSAMIQMDLAWINAVLGDNDSARDLIAIAKAAVPRDPYVHYIEGLVFNETGDKEQALRSFTHAVERGYPRKSLAQDPNLPSKHSLN